MFQIDKASGQVIAKDTQKSIEALDNAVMSMAQLCASIVEVSKASRLPVSTAQAALARTADGLSMLVKSRDDMSWATSELVAIQKESTLRTVSFGCPPFGSLAPAADEDPVRETTVSKLAA